jgi:transcriptional regulator with PAS, ATPase and Fis domain/tetratricopeptide (TPR) repeat protein
VVTLPGSEIHDVEERLQAAPTDADRAALALRLGILRFRRGEGEKALVHLWIAHRELERAGDRHGAAVALQHIGATCGQKGETERAAVYFQRALESAAALGDDDLAARIANDMADAALAHDDEENARALWQRAAHHFQRFWDGAALSRIYCGLARLCLNQEDYAQAEQLSGKALEDAEAAQDPLVVGRALLCCAHLKWKQSDLRAAKRCFRRAISVFSEHDLMRDLAESYLAFGRFVGSAWDQLPEGFPDPPAFWLAKAQALFQDFGSLADLERVRDAFRRHGRRRTDRVAEVEVLRLLEEMKRSRVEAQKNSRVLAAKTQAAFSELATHATPERKGAIEEAREEAAGHERALADTIDRMALAEELFLAALNEVILERENIHTLLELCRALASQGDVARLPQDIAKMAAQLTGADRALVAFVSETGALEFPGALRIQPEEAQSLGPALERAVSKTGTPALLAGEPRAHPAARLRDTGTHRALDAPPLSRQPPGGPIPLGAAMVCPLRLGERVFGALYVDKALCGGVFSERDLDLLAIFAAQVGILVENLRTAEGLALAARTRAATLEAISDGVLSLSADGRVTAINATASRILGLGGLPRNDLRLASLPELSFLGGLMARGEDQAGRVTKIAHGEYLLNARCVRGASGKVVGLVATVTEMKRATSLAQRIVGSTARFTFGDLIGNSAALRRRMQLAAAAAPSDSSVLITGESGTGKELVAQAIHNAGPRAAGPFVGINCAAIPRELLESELFGYEAGAFTGAKRGGHPGKFELADGGTILLDEIGDMPLEMQAKLLRVLQEKRVQRLGGTREIPLHTRLIATTNRDLAEDCARGRFRQDLFFRLRVVHIELPPLRERSEDIPLLVEHFLKLESAKLGKVVRGVTPDVLGVLRSYPWPGNVRELEHVLESEVNLAAPDQELLCEIPVMLSKNLRGHGTTVHAGDNAMSMAEHERQLLLQALATHHGHVPDVARALGVSRGTVYNKMKKFHIDPAGYRH